MRELADEALAIAQAVSGQLASAMEIQRPESDTDTSSDAGAPS
jgi:hypothetical protein